MVVMAPGVGSTEMRYCGISLSRMLDRTTSALWPAVPTGGVPQRMSLGCCDTAGEPARPRTATTANAANARLSMAFPLWLLFLNARPDPAGPRSELVVMTRSSPPPESRRNDPPIGSTWQDPSTGAAAGTSLGTSARFARAQRREPRILRQRIEWRQQGGQDRHAIARPLGLALKVPLTRQADRVEAGHHL